MGAMFTFDPQGLLISCDDSDNPDNHVVLHSEAGTMASFAVENVGDAPGTCQVDVEIDDTYVASWVSQILSPGQSETPPFVRGLGRHPSGQHTFLAYLNPGAGSGFIDHVTNIVQVE